MNPAIDQLFLTGSALLFAGLFLAWKIKRGNQNFAFDNQFRIRTSTLNSVLTGCAVVLFLGCVPQEIKHESPRVTAGFDPKSLLVKDDSTARKVRGQVLYLPVYSNIPYFEENRSFNLNAFVAVHNTDLSHKLTITRVLFFDNDGNLVSNYLTKDVILQPLGATNFFVPERDKSGTGANFIVEWVAETNISEPLIESVMIGLTGGQGVSFSSVGRIIRESK
jgi:hypothetical protein